MYHHGLTARWRTPLRSFWGKVMVFKLGELLHHFSTHSQTAAHSQKTLHRTRVHSSSDTELWVEHQSQLLPSQRAQGCCLLHDFDMNSTDQKSWCEGGEKREIDGERERERERGRETGAGQGGEDLNRKGGVCDCTCTSGQTLAANEWSAPSSERKKRLYNNNNSVLHLPLIPLTLLLS